MTRKPAATAAAAVALLFISGCTGGSGASGGPIFRDPGVPVGALRLVAFDSCDDLLAGLRGAAKASVGPWGLDGNGGVATLQGGPPENGARAGAPDAAAPNAAGAPDAGGGAEKSSSTYSKTNAHEAEADEPDLVKTDGRRIVTVAGGVVRVVDAATRRVTGSLDVSGAGSTGGTAKVRYGFTDLLLSGDHLLLLGGGYGYVGAPEGAGIRRGPGDGVAPPGPDGKPIQGTQLTLVDLSGAPRIVSSYTVDGNVLDARQIGATARVVVHSAPRLAFAGGGRERGGKERDAKAQIAANQKAIDSAPLADWLPRYSMMDSDGKRTAGQVDCRSVHRPTQYSGNALLTVLTFDLGKSALDSGSPVSVVADGDTVYANGPSLYVANDQRWRTMPGRFAADGVGPPKQVVPETELYKFDISGGAKPRFVGGGKVDGWLLNQYSLSEWDGHLRVATTTAAPGGEPASGASKSESTVYVLRPEGAKLVEVGRVGGLGKGERIYSVRFVGPTGFVVTFRQTDPLYTVDLRDPKKPRVLGELKITGYSAYLHPAGDGRLLGIGQEANAQGRVQGTQVSLFDVGNLAEPKRLAQYHVQGAYSQAEFDPHAFLYWQATGTLAVPMASRHRSAGAPAGALLVLSVRDGGITELGTVEHPAAADSRAYQPIQRSLVIDQTLWTVSNGGLKASDLTSLAATGWVPFG